MSLDYLFKGLGKLCEPVQGQGALCDLRVSLHKEKRGLGKGLAGLINIFNPQLVVIGGKVAVAAGDYLMLPIRTAIKRHVLNIANQDTSIKLTKLRQKAAPIGAALLVRSRILGML